MIEFLKAIFFGIVEGITEWLPISSTGHMILLDEFLKLNASADFMSMFLVVIQLGAILAVVCIYFKKLWPVEKKDKKIFIERKKISMWGKILVACVPAAVIGLLFDDAIESVFYNWQTVSLSLIVFGILFIIIENRNKDIKPAINNIDDITYLTALKIGLFQLLAALFPGTSRSGATILGGLIVGVSRTVAAEFTFFLAVPVMFGASVLKIVKYGFNFTQYEAMILLVGMVVAFVVSIFIIKFLMEYIKKHDFKVFGWYRIVLGIIVIGYFAINTYLIK